MQTLACLTRVDSPIVHCILWLLRGCLELARRDKPDSGKQEGGGERSSSQERSGPMEILPREDPSWAWVLPGDWGPVLALEPEGQVPFLPNGHVFPQASGRKWGQASSCTGSLPQPSADGQPLGCTGYTGSWEQGDQSLSLQSTP